jgi:hypothetical protein
VSTFTVKAAAQKKAFEGKYGPSQVITLTLDNGSGDTKEAEWLTKAATPLPAVGSTLEGDLEPSEYGLNFKKAHGGGGFGGGRSPRDSRRIERQHSQEMSIRVLAANGALGPFTGEQPHPTTASIRAVIKEWTDWFVADLDADVGGGTGVPPPRGDTDHAAADVSAKGFASQKQKDHFERLLQQAGAKVETASAIVLYAENELSASGGIREAFDGLTSKEDGVARSTAKTLALAAEEWRKRQPVDGPAPDTHDLPPAEGHAVGAAGEDIPF